MVSVDWSVGVQIANFIILIFVLNKVLYKPIRSILKERKVKINGLEQTIDGANKDAQVKDEAFSAGIKDARSEGLKQKESLVQAASAEEKEIIRKINEKAQADMAAVREKIAKDAEAVRKSLLSEIDKFANIISQKLLGRAV